MGGMVCMNILPEEQTSSESSMHCDRGSMPHVIETFGAIVCGAKDYGAIVCRAKKKPRKFFGAIVVGQI